MAVSGLGAGGLGSGSMGPGSMGLARIKRGVRRAIELSGGIDGAGATAGRCRSVAGDWNNLNSGVFPPLDCAFALDEVALAFVAAPPIVSALARELGGVFVQLPVVAGSVVASAVGAGAGDALAGENSPVAHLLELTEQVGALASGVRISLADRQLDPGEADELRRLLGALIAAAAAFDLQLAGRP